MIGFWWSIILTKSGVFVTKFFFQRWKIGRDHPAATGGHSMPFPCGLCDSSRIQEVAEHGPWRRPQGAGDASATDWVNEIQRDPRDPRAKPGLCKESLVPCTKEFGCLMVCDKLWTKAGAGNGWNGDMGTGRQCQAVHSKPNWSFSDWYWILRGRNVGLVSIPSDPGTSATAWRRVFGDKSLAKGGSCIVHMLSASWGFLGMSWKQMATW